MTTPQPMTTEQALDELEGAVRSYDMEWGDGATKREALDVLRQALADKDAAAWQMVTAYADLKIEADILARAVEDREAEIERLRAAVERRGHDTI